MLGPIVCVLRLRAILLVLLVVVQVPAFLVAVGNAKECSDSLKKISIYGVHLAEPCEAQKPGK